MQPMEFPNLDAIHIDTDIRYSSTDKSSLYAKSHVSTRSLLIYSSKRHSLEFSRASALSSTFLFQLAILHYGYLAAIQYTTMSSITAAADASNKAL